MFSCLRRAPSKRWLFITDRWISQCNPKPVHLTCFKHWTPEMVREVIESAINLKFCFRDTHQQRMNVLQDCKVLIIQEINEPVLNMAVSKAATLLGAYDLSVIDYILWDQDYYGRVFSYMSDAIFVTTSTHGCLERFASNSIVPVLCMRSRSHATIQSLATVMAIIEEFGTMHSVNVAYFGPPHQVINSYLLLCPMLGANIKYKCGCDEAPVSPLLAKMSEKFCSNSHTNLEECNCRDNVLKDAWVIISGPTCKKGHSKDFALTLEDIEKHTGNHWIYFHTCPKGQEVGDNLFLHNNARTFKAFENMQFIAAALMAYTIRGFRF